MRDNKKIIIIYFLIVLYFVFAIINSNFISNYIVYSNTVYKVKNNNIVLSDSVNIINKKINLVNKNFGIENAYYKKDNTGNNELFLYDKKYKSVNKDRYYYGYTNDLKVIKFNENSSLNDDDINNITNILKKSNISFSIKDLNYYKVVKFDNNKLIFLGNFNDNQNYRKTINDLQKDNYYEFIILKSGSQYRLIKKIVADKNDFFDTNFLLFDCIIKGKNYYVGIENINYSFFDGGAKKLYELKNNLELIK